MADAATSTTTSAVEAGSKRPAADPPTDVKKKKKKKPQTPPAPALAAGGGGGAGTSAGAGAEPGVDAKVRAEIDALRGQLRAANDRTNVLLQTIAPLLFPLDLDSRERDESIRAIAESAPAEVAMRVQPLVVAAATKTRFVHGPFIHRIAKAGEQEIANSLWRIDQEVRNLRAWFGDDASTGP